MRHVFRITLRSFAGYDSAEKEIYVTRAVIEETGTEDDAIAAARKAEAGASEALIERVAVAGGLSFRDYEIKSFTIGIGD